MNPNETVFDWCKAHKEKLIAGCASGDHVARNIINLHDMYVRHPERIALTLLECAVDDWKKREAKP